MLKQVHSYLLLVFGNRKLKSYLIDLMIQRLEHMEEIHKCQNCLIIINNVSSTIITIKQF